MFEPDRSACVTRLFIRMRELTSMKSVLFDVVFDPNERTHLPAMSVLLDLIFSPTEKTGIC